MILGITGGMGCGKSAVAGEIAAQGFQALDSDALIRERVLVEPGVVAAIRARCGDGVLTPEQGIDRRVLAGRVFQDPELRRWLEELTHPRLFDLWRERMRAEPAASWVVEAPLLFEARLEIWFDFTVCVACSPEQQLVRLEQRGLPRALAELRISQQLPLTQKLELADLVLWNDGSRDFLHSQVRALILALPAASP